MFTGIIEEVGEIAGIDDRPAFRTIRVRASAVLQDMQIGSSIAVNGVCLTARSVDADGFTAELSRETLDRTSLQHLKAGALVNLERPMRADGRFGAPHRPGHVTDSAACARSTGREIIGFWRSKLPNLRPVHRRKGSVAVDGISLTVAAVNGMY